MLMRELKVAAEDVVHQIQRHFVGIVERRGQLRGDNQALPGAGAINEIDNIFLRLRNLRDCPLWQLRPASTNRKAFRAWA